MLKEMERTLGRLIGEQIEISFTRTVEIWSILINPTEYDQIIMNLVVNARDAMPHGGKLFISTDNVTVSDNVSASFVNATHGDYVVTTVTDSGIGIAQDIIERIFDPFFTTKEYGKGTGLGLSTVYGIVLKYGGFISVKSEPLKGSTFSIYLPRYRDEPSAVTTAEKSETFHGTGNILLVEDEEAVRDMIKLFLESVGFSVIAANTPEDAIEICRSSEIVDCVLSDVIMPGLNGRQLSEKILTIRGGLPFVFMSGYTSDIITDQGISEEGLHFIRKPLNFNDLQEKLLSAMRQA
jgi:CheY-like chemotaxis protein